MKIQMTIHIWREGDQYIAHAMPIDVASSGPTREAARAAVDEAVVGAVLTMQDMGTLEDVLSGCGYEKVGEDWLAPEHVSIEHEAVVA